MQKRRDSMGEMSVPDDALWGASTQRAVENFPISGHTLPVAFLRAMGLIKLVAARVNAELGLLDDTKRVLIQRAAREIVDGQHRAQFPIDVFQTGSATSTNMNVNEVIVARAAQLAGRDGPILHANDDVNMSQSSNDVIPSALHVSVALSLVHELRPALATLACALHDKAHEFAAVVKPGRTHLMDAIPITLGQEFSGYAAQIDKGGERVARAVTLLRELAIGGAALGTGLNAPATFDLLMCAGINAETGLSFYPARNHFEAQAARDDCVEVAGQLAAIVASLTKLANDLRLLGSGPRAGLAELSLPAVQPGSSIMPGKVNPVMSEMLVQVGLYVQGLMQTVMACGREGQLELNATLPLLAYCFHEAIHCLSQAARQFAERCVVPLKADAGRCAMLAGHSLMLVTALTPRLGYELAAAIATQAQTSGLSLRDVVLQRGLLTAEVVDALLNPMTMAHPHGTAPRT
jgi:fumarate hydratase, class II